MATERDVELFNECRALMDKINDLAFIALPLTFIQNKGQMEEFRNYLKVFADAKAAKMESEKPTDREIIEDVFQPYRG